MTKDELLWKLRDFDDDTEIETYDPGEGGFGEPSFELIERDDMCDGAPCKKWVLRL